MTTPLCTEKLDEFLIESGHLEKPGEDRDWPLWRIFGQHPADFETAGCNGYSFAATLS